MQLLSTLHNYLTQITDVAYVVDLQHIFDRKVYVVIGCTPSAAIIQSHAAQPLPVFVKGLPCKLNLVRCTFQTID